MKKKIYIYIYIPYVHMNYTFMLVELFIKKKFFTTQNIK